MVPHVQDKSEFEKGLQHALGQSFNNQTVQVPPIPAPIQVPMDADVGCLLTE